MVFSSDVFLTLFMPLSLAGYYLIDRLFSMPVKIGNIWLLLISLFFYAWGEPFYVLLMIFSVFVNYICGKKILLSEEKKKKKKYVFAACAFDIGLLVLFKYAGWLISLFDRDYSGFFSVIPMPVGISFYTFQAMSYVIDAYRKRVSIENSGFLNIALYISFFPQLIAGPIVRYKSIADSINERKVTFDDFTKGFELFARGLAKKTLLANQLAAFSDLVFARLAQRTVLLAWICAAASVLQVYFDFSGYSDMATGLGRMFGFRFDENFNYPLASSSITEYWRRWHISLGAWFRDYLFYPLSLGPAIKWRASLTELIGAKAAASASSYLVLLIVWAATGLWHGADFTFLIWGLLQFLFITIERYMKPLKNKHADFWFSHARTLLICILCGVIFNSDSMPFALDIFSDMFGFSGAPVCNAVTLYWMRQYDSILIISAIFAFPVIPKADEFFGKTKIAGLMNAVKYAALMLIFTAAVSFAISGGYNPFIYFNF